MTLASSLAELSLNNWFNCGLGALLWPSVTQWIHRDETAQPKANTSWGPTSLFQAAEVQWSFCSWSHCNYRNSGYVHGGRIHHGVDNCNQEAETNSWERHSYQKGYGGNLCPPKTVDQRTVTNNGRDPWAVPTVHRHAILGKYIACNFAATYLLAYKQQIILI